MPRMRTISGTIEELKKLDPETSITQHHVRQLVLTKKIKFTMAGNRYLVNFDSFLEYLNNPPSEEIQEPQQYGKLRKVGV